MCVHQVLPLLLLLWALPARAASAAFDVLGFDVEEGWLYLETREPPDQKVTVLAYHAPTATLATWAVPTGAGFEVNELRTELKVLLAELGTLLTPVDGSGAAKLGLSLQRKSNRVSGSWDIALSTGADAWEHVQSDEPQPRIELYSLPGHKALLAVVYPRARESLAKPLFLPAPQRRTTLDTGALRDHVTRLATQRALRQLQSPDSPYQPSIVPKRKRKRPVRIRETLCLRPAYEARSSGGRMDYAQP